MNKYLFIIIACTLALTACDRSRQYFPKDLPPVQIDIVRFDSALLALQSETVQQDVRQLYQDYPAFMPVFVEDILGIPSSDTSYLCQQIPAFLSDTVYGFAATNEREQALFADIEDIRIPLEEAFRRIDYLYPGTVIPSIYLFISGFNSSILFVEDDIAVGADMYLGSDYEFYNRVVYDYQKFTMRKECIPADVVSAYLFRRFPYTGTKSRLLDNMIYRGKIMYVLAQLFPTLTKAEVMGYTEEQWHWCKYYERDIWNLMMDKKDLFKTETLVLSSYLNDGPFTSEISQSAPSRLGTWVGWQIVDSYMEHNDTITLQSLIAEPDAEKILEYSHYRP